MTHRSCFEHRVSLRLVVILMSFGVGCQSGERLGDIAQADGQADCSESLCETAACSFPCWDIDEVTTCEAYCQYHECECGPEVPPCSEVCSYEPGVPCTRACEAYGQTISCGDYGGCQLCSSVCYTADCNTSCFCPGLGATNCSGCHSTCEAGCAQYCTDETDCKLPCMIEQDRYVTCGAYGRCWEDAAEQATPGSCRGYCGHRWDLLRGSLADEDSDFEAGNSRFAHFDDGCSCEEDCGYRGTCCPDVAQHCTFADGTPFGDGMQWPQVIGATKPVDIISMNGSQTGDYSMYEGVVIKDGFSTIALAGVDFANIDDTNEHAECAIEPHHENLTDQDYWFLKARSDSSDSYAACTAVGLRWSQAAGITQSDPQDVKAGDDDPDTVQRTLGSTTNTFPLLTWVKMENLDDASEQGRCTIAMDQTRSSWVLSAHANDDAEAWCTGRLLNYPGGGQMRREDACPWGVETRGHDYWVASCTDGEFSARAGGGIGWHWDQLAEISMYPDGSHFCSLTQVLMTDVDDHDEHGGCELFLEKGRWWLRAKVVQGGDDDMVVSCKARCLRIHNSAVNELAGWPPVPSRVIGASNSVTLGARFELFQSGTYDKPLVLFEGFDPTNKQSIAYHVRLMGGMMRLLFAAGYDIWVIDNEDAGGPVLDTMRENAKLIDFAYKYDPSCPGCSPPYYDGPNAWYRKAENQGKRIAAAGLSMGALAGRSLLATWEDGKYSCAPRDPGNPNAPVDYTIPNAECISATLGIPGQPTRPPVALFAGIAGPQTGAEIPVGVQMVVQDIGNWFDLGEPLKAINSPAAINMLRHRFNNQDPKGVVTQWCDGNRTLRNGDLEVWGTERSLDTSGCTQLDGNTCVGQYQVVSSRFFDELSPFRGVNRRGVLGNGYPQQVVTLGVTNASWRTETCDAFPENVHCSDFWDDQAVIGQLHFVDEGHYILNSCERHTEITVHLRTIDGVNERIPADFTGRTIAGLGVGPMPKQVTEFGISQFMPLGFIPTESALHCNGAGSDAACLTANRSSKRFTRVMSSASPGGPNVNGAHTGLAGALAVRVIAFLRDAYADADGYCGASTPTCNAALEGADWDCDDTRANVHPGATELCDGRDNNCDGRVDEDCACFVAGTEIAMADGSRRRIDDVRVGDEVLSYDPASQLLTTARVLRTFMHAGAQDIVVLNGMLEATANHPFFVDGRWVRADELEFGDPLVYVGGAIRHWRATKVTSLGSRVEVGTVYNLDVDGDHAYFAAGILVHNKETPPPIQGAE